MPRTTERRELLADAAVRVLADAGIHGLTHRAVDARASVPVGTTSRYFRTRASLLRIAAETIRDHHRAYLENLAETSRPGAPDLAEVLARILADGERTQRDLYLARIELALESRRTAELRPILEEMRTLSITAARLLAGGAGIELSEAETDLLGTLLVGITLDRVTLGRPRANPTTLAGSLIGALGRSAP